MKIHSLFVALTGVLTMAGLAACGSGSGGGGVAGSGSSVVGSIAGFGSIIMSNGKEYDTSNISSCMVDDQSAPGRCEDSLSPGMTVRLELDPNGAVESVEYDDDLEGPALNVSGSAGNFSFMLFGATVMTTDPGTQWSGFSSSPPLLAELDGANVEISGEWQNGTLYASYVELQGDTSHEAEGQVGTVNGTSFTLLLKDGTSIGVDAASANQVPQAGDYVEVEGTWDGVTFTATRVEFEDPDDFDADGEADITGTLVQDAGSSTGYTIGSTEVDISNAPSCSGLEGTMVEAEGSYDQSTSVLVVDKCEDEEDELEMECLIGDVSVPDPASPKVGSLECGFPGTSGGPLLIEFRDSPSLATFDDDSWDNPFDLTDVNSGDCVQIEAGMDSSGNYVAGMLELVSAGAACEKYKLGGPVNAFTDLVSITVLGISYSVDATTAYPDGLPVVGDRVKITDSDADGVADSVEIDS